MGNGKGAQIIGGLVAVAVGVLVIAGIFQLNQNKGAGVASDTTSIANNTLSSVFKG